VGRAPSACQGRRKGAQKGEYRDERDAQQRDGRVPRR
jgi:hypothetical protein